MSRARAAAHRLGLRRALKAGARGLGFDLVTRNYYSAIPDFRALPPEAWTRESALRGLRWDLDAQLRFVERELGPHLAEFAPPPGFDRANGTYEGIDAETAYAVVRHFRPGRILELGSGFSTLVLAAARERNAQQGAAATQVACDPFARADLATALAAAAEIRAVSAADLPEAEITALGAGDVLFVDTTHTVKLGGDVNRIVLELLPLVPPGVLVHFHDVFLPGEYPRALVEAMDVSWAEQYLLQAFLAYNPTFEVLFANAALYRHRGADLRRLVASEPAQHGPSALWLRRAGRTS